MRRYSDGVSGSIFTNGSQSGIQTHFPLICGNFLIITPLDSYIPINIVNADHHLLKMCCISSTQTNALPRAASQDLFSWELLRYVGAEVVDLVIDDSRDRYTQSDPFDLDRYPNLTRFIANRRLPTLLTTRPRTFIFRCGAVDLSIGFCGLCHLSDRCIAQPSRVNLLGCCVTLDFASWFLHGKQYPPERDLILTQPSILQQLVVVWVQTWSRLQDERCVDFLLQLPRLRVIQIVMTKSSTREILRSFLVAALPFRHQVKVEILEFVTTDLTDHANQSMSIDELLS